MLTIRLDEGAQIVRAAISGVLTVEEARRFRAELTAAAEEARRRYGRFLLIADTLEAPVQPQDVIAALPTPADLIADPADRWCVIVSSQLARMQATRILGHPQALACLSSAEAEIWVKG